MALNEIFKHSDWIPLPVDDDTPSGSPFVVGGITGVTQTAEGEGGNQEGWASCALTGAFELAMDGGAITVGTAIYVTHDDPGYSIGATGDALLGHAITAKASGTGERFVVRLSGHGTDETGA